MVRPVNKSDREVVGRLWSALMTSQAAIDERFAASEDARERWDNDFPQWIHSESRKMYVAVDGETVCGFATVERWNPPPIYRDLPGIYVDEIFVDPSYRLRGHGHALVDAIRQWGHDIGARELRSGVLAENRDGCAFWEKVGGNEMAMTYAVVIDVPERGGEGRASRIGFQM